MPEPALVTQAELAAVLASYNALGQTILGIRRRIEAGAAVEDGKYTARSNEKNPISSFDKAGPNTRIGMYGLNLEEQTGGVLRAHNFVTMETGPRQAKKGEPHAS